LPPVFTCLAGIGRTFAVMICKTWENGTARRPRSLTWAVNRTRFCFGLTAPGSFSHSSVTEMRSAA
jgi:hypothetical protein